MQQIPIHLAIPSYNNAGGLKCLLSQVVAQPFASVSVLDDGSTDDTRDVVANFPAVRHIVSDCNQGPVAAKNLILQDCPNDGFLVFLDSDMKVVTPDIPQQLQGFLMNHSNVGIVGGFICIEGGAPMPYSRGYDPALLRIFIAPILYILKICLFNLRPVQRLYQLFTVDHTQVQAGKFDWVTEGFFAIEATLFQKLGGFDTAYQRFGEGTDLCLRVRKHGRSVWFCPSIKAMHVDQHTGSKTHRLWHLIRSLLIYYWKHPSRLLLWGVPRP